MIGSLKLLLFWRNLLKQRIEILEHLFWDFVVFFNYIGSIQISNITIYMQQLSELANTIYSDCVHQNRKNYKTYGEQLTILAVHHKDTTDPNIKDALAISFYNLAKLSNRYRFVLTALQLKQESTIRIKWWLQMLALASSRDSHAEAYNQACRLVDHLLTLILALKLPKEQEMLGREIAQLVHRPKTAGIFSESALNQLELSRKFETDCQYVNKIFHVADVMIMQPIDPNVGIQQPILNPSQTFFIYLVYLSIACFTRATQKFYCRESSDRDFHFKAIQIAAYIYSGKSTYMRFLRRTFREHYLEHLDQIEEVDQYGERKIPVSIDAEEVALITMPWDTQQLKQIDNSNNISQ